MSPRTVRPNEWNFCSNIAEAITNLLRAPEYSGSPLGHAEAELTEFQGVRRLDLVFFRRGVERQPIVTAEVKGPWDPIGRTPYNSRLVADAHSKASTVGALFFITWNIRRLVLWKTDDPGVALNDRVLDDYEFVPASVPLSSANDLDRPAVKDAVAAELPSFIASLHSWVSGPPRPSFLPLDRLFVARIEAALDFPIARTAEAIKANLRLNQLFKRRAEKWMREIQGWTVTAATEAANADHAARFTCYVLLNRLCFYNALRRKYSELPRLVVANNIATGTALEARLREAFNQAKRYTGDYETVFDGDVGDTFPFLSDDTVPEWRSLIRSLDRYDFASISLDVIGAMYEQLIKPAERHRYGQHYTQPAVVDLINAFAIKDGRDSVLDPGCGGGTFLVRAYARKKYLAPDQEHSQLLERLYGCDILNYACHLSIINLAIRDLIDDDNFPRIHQGDFLRYEPNVVFSTQPVRIQAGGLVTDMRQVRLQNRTFNAIVGNPPYISIREMRPLDQNYYVTKAQRTWPGYTWRRVADIYTYFFLHAEKFLRSDGVLALLTQAGWLDVDYGIPLQRWMLEHFRIVAVMETEAEPWFTDARVATAVTIIEREDGHTHRRANSVRFVQFRRRLGDIAGDHAAEHDRQRGFEGLRDRILQAERDVNCEEFRIRIVSQAELEDEGIVGGRDVGSKWGRYLRSTDTLYALQDVLREAFTPLRQLGPVKRGITTNCDKFFIVSDVSLDALKIEDQRAFRENFGVRRALVESGELRIVRRSDGYQQPLENIYLRPMLKTARDVEWFSTSQIENSHYAVTLQDGLPRLSEFARRYVAAGEREDWHLSPSFESIHESGGNWYSLRDAEPAPILFVKTMQYTPVVLLNDAGLIANQRLYKVEPVPGVSPLALCAVLNSTLFACERYAAVKALGREAAIDVEVFSANAFRVPDMRRIEASDLQSLESAMLELAVRRVGPMVEEHLLQLGLAAARAYVQRHPISPDIWPQELCNQTRQTIDRIVLKIIGVPQNEIEATRRTMCDELVAHTRRLRILELEAQLNRQGQAQNADLAPGS